MSDEAILEGDGFTFAAHYSTLRRRWVGRCTCGATLKPIFRDRFSRLPLDFMDLHARASHAGGGS